MVFPHVIVVCFFKVAFPSDRFPSAGFTPWWKNIRCFLCEMSAYNHQIYTCFCEKSRAKLEWCAAIFPIAGEFTKLSEQSRSGHLKQIFSSQITRIGDGDWSDWLAIPNVRTKPLGRRIHPHSTGDLYRLKNLFASLEIVQNSHGKENHSNMFPPVIISFEVFLKLFLCDGLVVCHIPSAPGHAAAPCGGSVDGSPHWNALPCAVHARAHVHRSPIMDHEISWNGGYQWISKKNMYDIKFHSTWNQLRSHKCIYTLYTYHIHIICCFRYFYLSCTVFP